MDAESLKSLGTLIFWGLLFFLMMRFGCGTHMMGGHGHHGSHGGPAGSDGGKDPVCGMAIEPGKAVGASVHAGKTYYFCSTTCRDKFEKEPAKYAAAAASDEHKHGGCCHG